MADEGRGQTLCWGDCNTCALPDVACRTLIERANQACCEDCRHLGTRTDDARSQA